MAVIAAACMSQLPGRRERQDAIRINVGPDLAFWQRMDFFRVLGIPSGEAFARQDPEGRFFPIKQVDTPESIDEISQQLSAVITDDNNLALYIQYLVAELVGNAIDHAEWAMGVLVTSQFYPQTERVQMAIVDCGKGIMASLSEDGAYHPQDHGEALRLSLRPWVTGKATQSRMDRQVHGHVGCGLTIAARLVEKTNGYLALASGDAGLVVPSHSTEQINHWPGTLVVIELYRDRLQQYYDVMREVRRDLGSPRKEGRFRFE
jgi:hypothetical protein